MKCFVNLHLMLLGAALILAISFSVNTARAEDHNTITIRSVLASVLNGAPAIEVEVSSDRIFPAINSAPVLQIGTQEFYLNRYPSGNLNHLIFTLTLDQFSKTADGDLIFIHYPPDSQPHWEFGRLDKSTVIYSNTQPTRSFYMGFTPFPYDISLDAVNFTYNAIATDADLIANSFDDGIPWNEALNDQPFPANIMNDWTWRRDHTPKTHKVYVAITPLNFLRTGLASYRGDKDNMPLSEPWSHANFDDVDVEKAYLNYCNRVIAFFKPDFLNIGIEANLLLNGTPEQWPRFLALHKYIYGALKKAYPNLPIMVSFSAPPMLDGYTDGDAALHRHAWNEIKDFSDYFALSLYPYATRYTTVTIPPDMFEQLGKFTDKPMAIAETGYPAKPFTVTINGGKYTFQTDADKQYQYISLLLTAAQAHNYRFVVNFVLRDYDALWQKIAGTGGAAEMGAWWRDTGLYNPQGQPRKSLTLWRSYLALPVS